MRIILTGGGTGGHIFPNIAIVEEAYNWKIPNSKFQIPKFLYIGERNSMEEDIIRKENLPFKSIYCGKMRRYFSFKNFLDWLKIPIGIFQSFLIIKKFNPDVIFSKGGYVSVPVVIAGYLLKKKIITHDSDSIPGLSTKINSRMAKFVCLAYEEASKFFPKNKVKITGIPTPKNHLEGSEKEGFKLTGFTKTLPVVLIFGGSLGAESINEISYKILPKLLKTCQVVHLTGRGKNKDINLHPMFEKRYFPLPFYNQMGDLYAITDLAVSRAGANAIAELQNWSIPSILIPLSKKASHGDQIINAEILKGKGGCEIILQEELTENKLYETIISLLKDEKKLKDMSKKSTDLKHKNSAKMILELIKEEKISNPKNPSSK